MEHFRRPKALYNLNFKLILKGLAHADLAEKRFLAWLKKFKKNVLGTIFL